MLEYKDMNSVGGVSQGRLTEARCRDTCFADPSCLAADYDVRAGFCHFHPTAEGDQHNACCTRYLYTCGSQYLLLIPFLKCFSEC